MLIYIIVVTMILMLISIQGYYNVKYKQWIRHPLSFNLLFKWNHTFSKEESVIYTESICSSSFENLPSVQQSFVRTLDSHFNDLDIISIQTKKTSLINHKSKSVINDDIISSCVTSFEITGLSNFCGFFMNHIMLDYTNLNLQNKNDILLGHLKHIMQSSNNKISSGLFNYPILPFVNPLCQYKTYQFPTHKWNQPPKDLLHPQFKLFPLSKQNFHLFTNFMKTIDTHFEVLFHANFERIMHLIYHSIWFANILLVDDQVEAIYFFKIRRKSVLHCFASVNKCSDVRNFINAFKISFWNIAKKKDCQLTSLDSISHNSVIIENIQKKTHPSSVTPFAYYFYNHTYSKCTPNYQCLLLV